MEYLKNAERIFGLASFPGEIDYPLMNDYMFRSVMQSNEKVLKGFLCSLLRLSPDDVRTVQVLNPVELGKKISDKEFYKTVKPAFQIGILNFTLFPGHPEFFSTYKMMNIKNYHKYSDKFTIHVLDLTKTDLAEKEDKYYHLDKWAKLFKALTWEDYYRTWGGVKRTMTEMKEKITELRSSNEEKDDLIASLEAQLTELQGERSESEEERRK